MNSVHHADHLGVHLAHRVGMMLECSPCESLSRAAFMHHDDKGQSTLRHCAVLKGLRDKAIPSICMPPTTLTL